MFRIRRFGVIKTATVAAAMYFVLIVLFFVILAPFVAIMSVSVPRGFGESTGFNAGTGLAGLLLVGLFAAVVYAIVGWIVTAVACLLYNFVAGFVGGIEIQLEQTIPLPAPSWAPTTSSPAPPPPAAPSWGPPPNPPSPPQAGPPAG